MPHKVFIILLSFLAVTAILVGGASIALAFVSFLDKGPGLSGFIGMIVRGLVTVLAGTVIITFIIHDDLLL